MEALYLKGHGYVSFTEDYTSGQGNVIRILHQKKDDKTVDSFQAHLHLEIREEIEMPLGTGYSNETKGYLDPTKFIKENRQFNF